MPTNHSLSLSHMPLIAWLNRSVRGPPLTCFLNVSHPRSEARHMELMKLWILRNETNSSSLYGRVSISDSLNCDSTRKSWLKTFDSGSGVAHLITYFILSIVNCSAFRFSKMLASQILKCPSGLVLHITAIKNCRFHHAMSGALRFWKPRLKAVENEACHTIHICMR